MTSNDAATDVTNLPRVLVKPRRALPFFHRHPWVYKTAVSGVSGNPSPGAEVAVFTHDQEFLGRGLINPNSQILVRLYGWDAGTPLDEAFWSSRLDAAIALRRRLPAPWGAGQGGRFDSDTACRLVFSEADGLSGLTVDRYGDWLLVQFTSLAMAERKETIVRLLEEKLHPRGIWLRTEKGMRENEGLEAADGLIRGEAPPRPLTIRDGGVQYRVDVVEGQKTGGYLDQSANRIAAARYCSGRRVLDLFCYSGGFGITALKEGGATDVLAVDVSESALALAALNAALNGVSDRIRFEKSKAFDALERLSAAGEKFDTVILDPPKMARNRASLNQALRGYFSLNRLALDVLSPGGILVTCSCTGLVTHDDFREVLSTVAAKSGRAIRVLESRGASPDHPTSVHCPETNYLKCVIAAVE